MVMDMGSGCVAEDGSIGTVEFCPSLDKMECLVNLTNQLFPCILPIFIHHESSYLILHNVKIGSLNHLIRMLVVLDKNSIQFLIKITNCKLDDLESLDWCFC